MKSDVKKVGRFVYWMPRIFSIVFIFFLAAMSLDVFSSATGFWQILLGLFIHNIPVFILIAVLVISWKREVVGGIAFISAGIVYVILIFVNALKHSFEWYMLSWTIQISGLAFLIGILFLIGWKRRNK